MAQEPQMQEAIRAAGLPAPSFEGYEVLVLNVTERARSLAPSS
jgi:hypothetical protein